MEPWEHFGRPRFVELSVIHFGRLVYVQFRRKKNAVGKFYLQIFVQVIFKIPNKGPNSWAICPIFPQFSSMIFPAIYLHLVRECPFSSGIYPLAATVAMLDCQIIGSYIPLSYCYIPIPIVFLLITRGYPGSRRGFRTPITMIHVTYIWVNYNDLTVLPHG